MEFFSSGGRVFSHCLMMSSGMSLWNACAKAPAADAIVVESPPKATALLTMSSKLSPSRKHFNAAVRVFMVE